MANSPIQPAVIEASAFQQSSPLSLRQQPHSPSTASLPPTNHDYNFSGAVYDESTSGAESEDLIEEHNHQPEHVLYQDQRIFSGCSSISSFPASILPHLPEVQDQHVVPRTPSKRDAFESSVFAGSGEFSQPTASPRSLRERPSPFRHPSSVRELQMRDEVMSETHSVLRHHRRSGSQTSSYSQRSSYSAHISPAKRSARSYRSSPSKSGSNLKKEFPLVLLHCTLLSPNIRVQPGSIEESLVVEVLPEDFKQRWFALRTKLVDVEISSRGILIPHPHEDMALLEERLLESLELEKPRIRHNHYFQSGGSAADSGFESAGTEDEADQGGTCRVKCPDCGSYLHAEEVNPNWEVKVFAANGLMRAGAWAAAWQEMEKVDVEVNVWLPEEIRLELQAKLTLLEAPNLDTAQLATGQTWADLEPSTFCEEEFGDSRRSESQTNANGAEVQSSVRTEPTHLPIPPVGSEQHVRAQVTGYAKGIAKGWTPVLVGLLSLLVLFLALNGVQRHSSESLSPTLVFSTAHATEVLTTTITTTSIAMSTAIVTGSAVDAAAAVSSPSEQASAKSLESESGQASVEQPLETNISAVHEPAAENMSTLPEAPSPETTASQSSDI